jgi:hypothetical protein
VQPQRAQELPLNRSVKVGIRKLVATETGTSPLGRRSHNFQSVVSPTCYYTFGFFVLAEVLIGTGRFWELRVRKAALKRSSNSRAFADTFRGAFCDRRTMGIASVIIYQPGKLFSATLYLRTMNSIRRLRNLPSSVSFDATGFVSPFPLAASVELSTAC